MNTADSRTCQLFRRMRRIRIVASILPAAGAATILSLTAAAPARAETDSLSRQCIAVGGYTRACLEVANVHWRSGWSWGAGGGLYDHNGGDYWSSTMEIKLNRPSYMSNTAWMRVLRVNNWQRHVYSISGYDPTLGAWVRLCSTSPGGIKYCLASRYVTDNS